MLDSKLEVLQEKRESLLLAEVAALLHDWQKCIDMAVASHWQKNRILRHKADEWQKRSSSVKPSNFSKLLEKFLILDDTEIDLKTLCEEGKKPSSAGSHSNPLVRLLGACHSLGHVEKELKENEANEQACDRVSSAFGFEFYEPEELFKPLLAQVGQKHLQSGQIRNRVAFIEDLRKVLLNAWGDTRRPINEVTLWDWSYAVACLYKSELARRDVTGVWRDSDLVRWRLLRVNFDVLGLYAKAIKIGDLLAYQGAVQRACETVKQLVEEEYPLGNEVYRDTTGIYFTFPDLGLWDELISLLRKKIEEVEPELAPRIAVERGKGNTASEQLKTLLSEGRKQAIKKLTYPFDGENLSDYWGEKWHEAPANSEVCPVCRLRPMDEGAEACMHCSGRRRSRIEWWRKHPSETIWLDEIADHNGRIALIVGKFGLDGWLSGDLVQTMLVKAVENKPSGCEPKNPSPARLRRVWETCERFWTETVVGEILEKHEYGKNTKNPVLRRTRILISPDNKNWRENIPYDGNINGQPISLLWDDKQKQFLSIINLQLAAGNETDLVALMQKWQGNEIEVGDPDNRQRRLRFKVQGVVQATEKFASYQPNLPVLTSPDRFLAFIPTSDALEITGKIRQEYIRQFGKVQNRLPLFLGLVFFQRKTPLVAAVDTARRMLEQVSLSEESWIVDSNKPTPDCLKRQVSLSRNGERISFEIPVKMGDDQTEDIWYPYFFIDGGPENIGRKLCFQHNGRWLVHVNELNEGDYVGVTPSRFAYFFLESAVQRFRFVPEEHALYLDDLTRLMKMWESLCHSPGMSQTRLKAMQALFLNKRQLWRLDEAKAPDYAEQEKTFLDLVKTTLIRDKVQEVSENDVMNGLFGHCLELYLRILKYKVKEEEHEQEPATV